MKHLSVAIAALFLAACQTTEQAPQVSEAEKIASYAATCQMYGHQPGTNGMAQCVQQERYAQEQKRLAQRADERQRFQQAMASLALISESSQPRLLTPAPTTTNCSAYGNTWRCSTF